MRGVLREYSKSQLEKVVEHAVTKQLVAERSYRWLQAKVLGLVVASFLLGAAIAAALLR